MNKSRGMLARRGAQRGKIGPAQRISLTREINLFLLLFMEVLLGQSIETGRHGSEGQAAQTGEKRQRAGGRVWSVVVVAGLGQKAKRITVRSRLSQR